MQTSLKPIRRSKLRIFLGKKYYRLKRYASWYFDGKDYAKQKRSLNLKHKIFSHKTPLLRQLKDVDMWMQYNKITNLKIASEKLTGITIKPNETFSYWRLLGNTTKRKGYVPGMVLFYGKVITGVGGGLCQLSNLIYWMTIHTPLTITERYRHSYDVFPDSRRNQPFGSGATCAYNYLDLQITNHTANSYQLVLSMTDTHLIGEWRSDNPAINTYKVYEKEHAITMEYWGRYVRHNRIHRKVYNLDQTEIEDEFITENHAIMMYEPLLSGGQSSEKNA